MSDPLHVLSDSVIEPSHDQVMTAVRAMVARGALLAVGKVQLADLGEELQNFHRASVRLIRMGSPNESESWVDYTDDPDDDTRLIARQYRSIWGWFSVQHFRDGAIDRANRMRDWMRSEEFGLAFGPDGGGYRVGQINAVINLTGLELHEQGQFRKRPEQRAKLEFWMNWEQRVLANIARIEGFTVEGNGGVISDGHRRTPLTMNVDRPAP